MPIGPNFMPTAAANSCNISIPLRGRPLGEHTMGGQTAPFHLGNMSTTGTVKAAPTGGAEIEIETRNAHPDFDFDF